MVAPCVVVASVAAVMRRLVRGLWSLFWLLALLAGVPAALVGFAGWPLPDHWPTAQQWQRWVQHPLSRAVLVDTAAIIGWLLWALLVYAVVVETLRRGRRTVHWLGRLPLPTPMQATVSGMLGATMFGIAAPTVSTAPHADGAVQPAVPASPAVTAPSTGAAPPAADDPAADHVAADQPTPQPGRVGVTLPDGGWVTDDTATAVAAAGTLVWLRRRRRYLPEPPHGARREDADLAPLPDTVTVIQDGACGRHAADETEDDPARVTDPAATPATADPMHVQAGEARRPADLPPGGVGFTGAGAAAAGRGLLVAMLLSGGDRDTRLITTATDLDILLGPNTHDLHGTPGLTLADGLDDALTQLEQTALERARATHDATDATDATGMHDHPGPLTLLTASPTDPATAHRIAVLLTLAAPLHITGVLLGAWPHATTWHVQDDGTVEGTDPAGRVRLSVLTATAAMDLLGLLRDAHPSRAHPAGAPAQAAPADHFDAAGAASTAGHQQLHAPDCESSTASIDPPAPARLRLRVLGTLSVHRADTATPLRIQRSAALEVLVFLAVHRDGATTGQLTAALWPGLRAHLAANRLYTPVSTLRTLLRQATGAEVLVRDGERYRLDDRHLDVDLWRLHGAVDEAATALDPADRQRALRTVIDTYHGELAAGRQWPWLAVHREAARRHAIDAYATLAATDPDPQVARALLQDALRVDPYNEDLHRRAMRAYADAGDSPTARHLLAQFTSRLAAMGLETADPARDSTAVSRAQTPS